MMVSCPKKSSHTEVLADRITSIINDEMGDDSVMLALSSLFGGSISKYVVNNCVDVKDYVLCSVGKFEYEGKSNTVSAGENNGADLCPFDKTWQGYSLALPPWSPTISEIPKTPSNGQRQLENNLVAGGVV